MFSPQELFCFILIIFFACLSLRARLTSLLYESDKAFLYVGPKYDLPFSESVEMMFHFFLPRAHPFSCN
jgi:hypothetical protein